VCSKVVDGGVSVVLRLNWICCRWKGVALIEELVLDQSQFGAEVPKLLELLHTVVVEAMGARRIELLSEYQLSGSFPWGGRQLP
jgi:hypothetical protein